jgi:hypothetical protein
MSYCFTEKSITVLNKPPPGVSYICLEGPEGKPRLPLLHSLNFPVPSSAMTTSTHSESSAVEDLEHHMERILEDNGVFRCENITDDRASKLLQIAERKKLK